MVNDHLSDFITRIRNGYMAGRKSVDAPMIKIVEKVAQVLAKEGYVEGVKRADGRLVVDLKYEDKKPVIMGIKRVSKPGARIYTSIQKIERVWGGLGKNILSTPKGIMSDKEARKLKTGGEIICQVW